MFLFLRNIAACCPPGAIGTATQDSSSSPLLCSTCANRWKRQYCGPQHHEFCAQEKATDLLLSAAAGVPQDTFLTEHLLNLAGSSSDDLTVSYFLRVIALLEQFSCPDMVITVAETGLAVAPQEHPERPTLAYILFSYHLKLGHNDDAYDAMVSNPDRRRRKDSLRQFLVTLFDRGELGVLAR